MNEKVNEIHIPLNIDSEESETKSEDIQRTEEQWTEKNEKFLKDIKQDALHKSNQHDIISHRNKKRYLYTSIPAMVIPLILANVSMVTDDLRYIEPIGLSIVSIINVFQTILNFSKKKEVHNTYAGKYAELAGDIDKILVRRKKYRQPFDVVLEKITTKKNQLDATAPYV